MSIGTWAAGRYAKGAVVYRDGAYYQASSDTSAPPPSASWQRVEKRYSPLPYPPRASKAYIEREERWWKKYREDLDAKPRSRVPAKPIYLK
jgi:hypothetical protein